jgi:F-type H+/Na+-transporting ATPase subunit alpha
MDISPQKLSEVLAQALTQDSPSQITERVGYIETMKDGVAKIAGLHGVAMGEVLEVHDGEPVQLLAMDLDTEAVYALVLDQATDLREGIAIKATGKSLSIPVGAELLGRVIDPLGRPLDNLGALKTKTTGALESAAPSVMERKSVDRPLHTGILAIDAMIPIGRGQRELIIGDRQTGKTSIALSAILEQAKTGVKCVYVAIGQRQSAVAEFIERLRISGALDYTVVINASAAMPATLQYLAPYAGAAVGEYFMQQGQDALVIFDDLSKHAVAYREVSLLLRRPPGREAYPGDVFYLHSRLLERAAQLSDERGGGSLTALPIIETQAGDVSAYIPTNVISITDGQIFLDRSLFNAGILPAINIGISVSRVGGAAQTPLIKKLAGSSKLELAQYYELAAFAQFASELDDYAQKQLRRGESVVEILKQDSERRYAVWEGAVLLFAASQGYFDGLEKNLIIIAKDALLTHVQRTLPEFVETITQTPKLTDEVKAALCGILEQQPAQAYVST